MERRFSLFSWNKRPFSLFLKDFQVPKYVSGLRVHLSIVDTWKNIVWNSADKMAPHSERQSYHTKKQGYLNKQIKPEEIIIR